MADGFEIDFSDIGALAASFDKLNDFAPKRLRQAMEVTARHVKDEWSDSLRGSRNLGYTPKSIGYEFTGTASEERSTLEVDIGAELERKQGSFVQFLEYGSPTQGPRGYGHLALQNNEADFEKGLTQALEDAEKDAGL